MSTDRKPWASTFEDVFSWREDDDKIEIIIHKKHITPAMAKVLVKHLKVSLGVETP